MGAIAASLADRVYLTNDNPRTEDPASYHRRDSAGNRHRGHLVELDRRRAIELAIAEARSGDAVLIAGKGHERIRSSAIGLLHLMTWP